MVALHINAAAAALAAPSVIAAIAGLAGVFVGANKSLDASNAQIAAQSVIAAKEREDNARRDESARNHELRMRRAQILIDDARELQLKIQEWTQFLLDEYTRARFGIGPVSQFPGQWTLAEGLANYGRMYKSITLLASRLHNMQIHSHIDTLYAKHRALVAGLEKGICEEQDIIDSLQYDVIYATTELTHTISHLIDALSSPQ